MSSGQRKRPGGAADSTPARKRSRLLPSSAGGTSQAEPIDLEQGGAPASEPGVIDLTGEDDRDLTGGDIIDLTGGEVIDLTGEDDMDFRGGSSEPEVIIISDDESDVDREQSQPQPHLFRASENSAEPLARADEEEPREDDGDWLDFDPPCWSDEDSEDREQDQPDPHVSSVSENAADLLAVDNEEELNNVDGAQPAGPASPSASEDEDSEDLELPRFLRTPENSAELPARAAGEEPRDNQGWTDSVFVSRFWMDYYSDWWYSPRRGEPSFVRAEDNSAMLVMGNNGEEQRDSNDSSSSSSFPFIARSANSASPSTSDDEDSALLQGHEEEMRNVTPNSQEQVAGPANGSGAHDAPVAGPANGSGAHDAPVAGPAPAGQGAVAAGTSRSAAQQFVVVQCPICMDSYSEIVQSGRQLLSTMCGHVFCSRCLPDALEAILMCPTCRDVFSPDLYHPVYL